jgi:hypothetical protein
MNACNSLLIKKNGFVYLYSIPYHTTTMDFTSIIVFIIVLFIYLHLTSQWKRSEDLEIYEMDYESNAQLQEVCDVKQPVLFDFKSVSPEFFENTTLDHFLENAKNQDVNVKDTNDYNTQSCVDSIILPFQTAHSLLKSDPASHLISEGNDEFIDECSHTKQYQTYVDEYLKPNFAIRTKYDICMGSDKSHTPFRYHTHSRHYCIVANGNIHVKMAPWKSGKHMHPVKDYENYEFFSNMNPWEKDSHMEKIKFLEFEVQEGYVLCIPPYWWYSIQYTSHECIVCTATYNTVMNIVANAKHWALYFFQQQNIQQKTVKTMDMNKTETESIIEQDNDMPENVPGDSFTSESLIKNLHHIGNDNAAETTEM